MADQAPIEVWVKRGDDGKMIACDRNGRLLDHQVKLLYTVSVDETPMVTVTLRCHGVLDHD